MISFNATNLEFVSVSGDFQTNLEGGRLEIYGSGAEYPLSDTITVTFRAKKAAITDVKLVTVQMDDAANATLEHLPDMEIINGTATVTIEKTGDAEQNSGAAVGGNGVVWVIIGIAAALLIAGGAVVLIFVKKKKQLPGAE